MWVIEGITRESYREDFWLGQASNEWRVKKSGFEADESEPQFGGMVFVMPEKSGDENKLSHGGGGAGVYFNS